MDPNETFRQFLNAQCDDNTEAAFEYINTLSDWVLNGGFCPVFPGSDTRVPAAFIHNTVVTFSLALDKLAAPADDVQRFKLHWLDGSTQEVEGTNIATACNNAGIGQGAIRALDYYERQQADGSWGR